MAHHIALRYTAKTTNGVCPSQVSEVQAAIASKQLVPTMRSQYMRVAYQIPFNPKVVFGQI
jgi:SPX domain protein involved in polyphosphate accumulation